MIPYPVQQFMAKRAGATVVEVPGSHAIYVSNPKAVADVIEQAASGIKSVMLMIASVGPCEVQSHGRQAWTEGTFSLRRLSHRCSHPRRGRV
jgi:hypothetical protein